ncbi:MAG: ABC transporter substrate-binding protein [bacterium]
MPLNKQRKTNVQTMLFTLFIMSCGCILFFTILCTLCAASSLDKCAEACVEILALQNIEVMPYTEALDGFKTACNCPVRQLLVTGLTDVDIRREVHLRNPDMILAIGRDALLKVRNISDTPIIYMMVLNPQALLSQEENISGIGLSISAEKQLEQFITILPEKKRIGLLFDPAKTGSFVKEAEKAAEKFNIELVLGQVSAAKSVPSVMKYMQGAIDAFWMIPDTTVLCPETEKYIIEFTIENMIPILSFSEKYVEMGAFMAVCVNAFELGKQAGEIAHKIIERDLTMQAKRIEPAETECIINRAVAKNLLIPLPQESFSKTRTLPESLMR